VLAQIAEALFANFSSHVTIDVMKEIVLGAAVPALPASASS
jgi:hypothetical protein